MRAILLKRFPARRVSRILGWTSVAITWGAVGMAAGLAASKEDAVVTPVPDLLAPPGESTAAATTTTSMLPAEPEGGLVILRGVPNPEPEPVMIVKRVIVQQQTIASAPRTQTSSGS